MYRITLYHVPAMRGGIDVISSFGEGSRYTKLNDYKVGEAVTELTFDDAQEAIYIADLNAIEIAGSDEPVDAANYMRVAFTSSASQPATSDYSPAWYWITSIDMIGARTSAARMPARIRMAADPWGDFFSTFGGDGHPFVDGLLRQTTKTRLFDGVRVSPPIPPMGGYENVSIQTLESTSAFDVRVFATMIDEQGAIYGLISDTSEPPNDVSVSAALQAFTTAVTIRHSSATAKNVNVLKCYVLPSSWIDSAWISNIAYQVDAASGLQVGAHLLSVNSTSVARHYSMTSRTVPPGGKVFVGTPGRVVELDTLTWRESSGACVPADIDIYVRFSGGNSGFGASDSLTIIMFDGASFTDISPDYEVSVAVNEGAARMAQQKTATALQLVTNVIGAAGGIAGGVASGNWFGAVQAAAGGVEAVIQPSVEKSTPARVAYQGGAMSAYVAGLGGLYCVRMTSPKNADAIDTLIEKVGLVADDPPWVTIGTATADFQAGEFYKFDACQWRGAVGGMDSAEEVCREFEMGRRFS